MLLLFHPNDVDNNHRIQYWHSKPFFRLVGGTPLLAGYPVPEATLEQRVTKTLVSRTYSFARLYRAAWILAARARILAGRARSLVRGGGVGSVSSDPRDKGNDDLKLTGSLLLAFYSEVERRGAKLVVVSVPTEEARIREFLKSTLEPHGIPYLALDEAFAASAQSVRFEQDRHWNAMGHRVAAAVIERLLLEMGILGGALAKDGS